LDSGDIEYGLDSTLSSVVSCKNQDAYSGVSCLRGKMRDLSKEFVKSLARALDRAKGTLARFGS
jgi:hypothetical protein